MEEVRSVAEYVECLKGYQRSGLCGCRPDVRYYYRGESRDYGATSGQAMIGREHEKWLEKHNEAKLFRECERRLTDEFLDCKSIFEKLVMMQHYGIPTRILDISLDPLVALFFALYLDPRGRKDGNDAFRSSGRELHHPRRGTFRPDEREIACLGIQRICKRRIYV